jgi:hypothetical protein
VRHSTGVLLAAVSASAWCLIRLGGTTLVCVPLQRRCLATLACLIVRCTQPRARSQLYLFRMFVEYEFETEVEYFGTARDIMFLLLFKEINVI